MVDHIPKFYGMTNENMVKHIKEYLLVIMVTMKADNGNEKALKLKVFPFFLFDHASIGL